MAYIGFFPVETGFQTVNFKQQNQTKRTSTQSGRIVRATNSITLWAGTLRFPPMTVVESKGVQAFVARCQGSLNEFDLIIPTISDTSSAYPNQNTYVYTDASAGATSVSVQSDVTSDTILKAGDIIRFHNHTKVYMVTEDVVVGGSGLGTINFAPNLVVDVPFDSAGYTIETNQVPIRMILSNDLQEFNYRTDDLVGYEIDVQEVY